jgi:hypothetical protein
MHGEAVTVTKAARSLADCVNRALYQGTNFVFPNNGVPVARIIPDIRIPGPGET